jgi:RHS repeat-associated protein
LGSTQLVTDDSGVAVQQVEYAPFGEVVNEYNIDWSNGQVPDFKFNAKELDEENGMYYFEARYQSPPVFISRDPLFEKYPMFSPYAFCANNPIKYIDPSGEDMELTDYRNTKGELLYKTNDGLNETIIVRDADVPELTQKLQSAQDNNKINDPEFNKKELHTLGKTPQQYTEATFIASPSDDWREGYKETYDKAYKGEGNSWISRILGAIIASIARENGDMGGHYKNAGREAGVLEGNNDKKQGLLNRLHPATSFKNNPPLIKLSNPQKQ